MREIARSSLRLLLLLIAWLAVTPWTATGYNLENVERVAAPATGGIVLLRGYHSRTGQLADSCIAPVKESPERGRGQPGSSEYKYVRSMEEVIRERSLDVNAKLSVGLGIGGASLGVESEFYRKNESRLDQGAAYATFYDSESAKFSSSRAVYRLTDDVRTLLTESIRKGQLDAFSKRCGDSVVIGTQRARFFQGFGYLTHQSSASYEQREIDVKLAARYLAVKLNLGVSLEEKQQERARSLNIAIDYIASGDAPLRGATNLKGFAEAFAAFQALPKHKTFDVTDIYTIPYETLLASKEFDLGLPRAQVRKVNRIVDGILLIRRARNSVRGDGDSADRTRKSLQREYQHLITILRRQNGCLDDEFSDACQNLLERFTAYPDPRNARQLDAFVETAASPGRECSLGYPVSKPNGDALCRMCAAGKEPTFLDRGEGRCGYVINADRKPGSKRFHLEDLQTNERRQIEAGVWSTVRVSPNFCDRPGTKCGEDAARRICQARKFADVSSFAVWTPPLNTLFDTLGDGRVRTVYANGEGCVPKPDAFTPIECKTFHFIDCKGGGS
jgi:hypothetical protein